MTKNITYRIKSFYTLTKKLELQLYPVVLRRAITKSAYDDLFDKAVMVFFAEYKLLYGFINMPSEVLKYEVVQVDAGAKTEKLAALVTKDIIQKAVVKAADFFASSGMFTISEPISFNGYAFYEVEAIEEAKEVIEKTIIVKENNTDEILKAISLSSDRSMEIKEWLPKVLPEQKEYDRHFGSLEESVKQATDYLLQLQIRSEEILQQLQTGINQLELSLQKAEQINSSHLQEILKKEYSPLIQVAAPAVQFPDIPAPQVEVNIKEVVTEVNNSLRVLMAQMERQFDRISKPKEVTFKVIYNSDQWPIEVVVKEN